jgi:hypothetical protein
VQGGVAASAEVLHTSTTRAPPDDPILLAGEGGSGGGAADEAAERAKAVRVPFLPRTRAPTQANNAAGMIL